MERQTEHDSTFRVDRHFKHRGKWYFATGEGLAIGPYTNRFEAVLEGRRLTRLVRYVSDPLKSTAIIRNFMDRQLNVPERAPAI